MNQKILKENLHTKAEHYYIKKFHGTKDKNEKYGDFYIILNENVIGFEVYAPEEPLSISTKKLKEKSLKIINEHYSIGGGLDRDRLNQFIERGLESKSHQFTDKITWSKILIICCHYPNAFSGLDNIGFPNPINNAMQHGKEKRNA